MKRRIQKPGVAALNISSTLVLILLLLVLAAVVLRVVYWPSYRIRRIKSKPFPDDWLTIIRHRLPFYTKLPALMQQQWQDLIKVFLHDKRFVGCGGLEINDDIRVTIAAQACLLVLNRNSSIYSSLHAILVYPSTFVVHRQVRDEMGLVSENPTAMLGESWDQGKVVLAWDNADHGVRNFHDGHNVVLHEFAHQLDSESGAANGAPLLLTKGAYKSWATVLTREFNQLQADEASGQQGLLDHYGATNPAEFFAVATETFFECPQQLLENHTELYRELAAFYQLDPVTWAS